jgi:hypothetical protein
MICRIVVEVVSVVLSVQIWGRKRGDLVRERGKTARWSDWKILWFVVIDPEFEVAGRAN